VVGQLLKIKPQVRTQIDPPAGPPIEPLARPPVRPHVWHWTSNRIAVIYLILATLLLPWLVILAIKLPDRQINQNYRLAWVGFDLLLLVALGRTAWLAWRRSPYLVIVASITAALLLVDAWFDVTTSATERDRIFAIGAAVLIEIPLAVFSLRLARHAQQRIADQAPRMLDC
jgi:hypothetical protein